MQFMNWIVDDLNSVSAFFHTVYLEVNSWIYPFWLAADMFYSLSTAFNWLAWSFADFAVWVADTESRLSNLLSWDTVWSYILNYIPNLIDLRDWFYDWTSHLTRLIDEWWSSMQDSVLVMIDEAKLYAATLAEDLFNIFAGMQPILDAISASITSMDAVIDWFKDWPGKVLSAINTWWTGALIQIKGLIDSAFLERESFWTGWQDWRGRISEFFTDPVEFIWTRFVDWFLGPEE